MKVGTDGVLLGAWATVLSEDKTFSVLDVGTGTGLIAMIVSQRNCNAIIDAIEIDKSACEQAIDNICKSPFKDRIKVIYKSFSDYQTDKKYDLIISNPPFFKKSLKCPDEKRSMARHNDSLPLKLLIEHAMTMLSESGRIAMILPVQQSEELDFIIATHRLFTARRTVIIPAEGLLPKRFLIEISSKTEAADREINTLTLETKDRKRTQQYTELTKDFYL